MWYNFKMEFEERWGMVVRSNGENAHTFDDGDLMLLGWIRILKGM